MTEIFEQLSQEEIINTKHIIKIKESIDVQYPHYTSKQKANKLANIIHDIIERSLPNYSNETKRNVRNSLLEHKLSPNSLTINSNDVVDFSLELVESKELQAHLPKWLQTKVDIEIQWIENYVNRQVEIRVKAKEEIAVTSMDIAVMRQFDIVNPNDLLYESFPPKPNSYQKPLINRKYITAAIAALFIMIPTIHIVEKVYTESNQSSAIEVIEPKPARPTYLTNALPSNLQYEPINEKQLRAWLDNRDSMLADEPYFSTIINVANEHNLHPFLLFAITGQEQGFVPRSNQKAAQIANNPFNVFHSWEDFNTNILNSSEIAARTIINLSEGRPKDAHPIQWINRKYAEDPNWWKGVSSIFQKLENEIQ